MTLIIRTYFGKTQILIFVLHKYGTCNQTMEAATNTAKHEKTTGFRNMRM